MDGWAKHLQQFLQVGYSWIHTGTITSFSSKEEELSPLCVSLYEGRFVTGHNICLTFHKPALSMAAVAAAGGLFRDAHGEQITTEIPESMPNFNHVKSTAPRFWMPRSHKSQAAEGGGVLAIHTRRNTRASFLIPPSICHHQCWTSPERGPSFSLFLLCLSLCLTSLKSIQLIFPPPTLKTSRYRQGLMRGPRPACPPFSSQSITFAAS